MNYGKRVYDDDRDVFQVAPKITYETALDAELTMSETEEAYGLVSLDKFEKVSGTAILNKGVQAGNMDVALTAYVDFSGNAEVPATGTPSQANGWIDVSTEVLGGASLSGTASTSKFFAKDLPAKQLLFYAKVDGSDTNAADGDEAKVYIAKY